MAGSNDWRNENLGGGKNACPVLEYPEPDCYCIEMASMDVHFALRYCLRDFRYCDIYRRVMKENFH